MHHTLIHSLTRIHTHIKVAGLALLTDAVANNTTFSELLLGGNCFEGPPAASHRLERKWDTHPLLLAALRRDLEYYDCKEVFVSAQLTKAPSLRVLSLCRCGVPDALVSELCGVLQASNNSITRLDLSSNEVGDAGAASLAELLKTDRTLSSVDLDRNHIGDEGGCLLSAALKENCALQELRLSGNKLSEASAHSFAVHVGQNRTIISLTLEANDVSYQSRKRIEALTLINRRRLQRTHVSQQKQLIERLEDEEELLFYTRKDILSAKTDLRDLKAKEARLQEAKSAVVQRETRASREEDAVLAGRLAARAILDSQLKRLGTDLQLEGSVWGRRVAQKEKALAQARMLREQAAAERDRLRLELQALTQPDPAHPARLQMLQNQQRTRDELHTRMKAAQSESRALLAKLARETRLTAKNKRGNKKAKQ
jgi:hypothetical protein